MRRKPVERTVPLDQRGAAEPGFFEGMLYLDMLIIWALAGRTHRTRLIRLCLIGDMETRIVALFLGVSEEAVRKQRRSLRSMLRKHNLLDCEAWRHSWQSHYSESLKGDAPAWLKDTLPWLVRSPIWLQSQNIQAG